MIGRMSVVRLLRGKENIEIEQWCRAPTPTTTVSFMLSFLSKPQNRLASKLYETRRYSSVYNVVPTAIIIWEKIRTRSEVKCAICPAAFHLTG